MRAAKKTNQGVKEGATKEAVLELRPAWDVPSYTTIRTCPAKTQVHAKGLGGMSLMCSRNRKKVGEQGKKEMKSEGKG